MLRAILRNAGIKPSRLISAIRGWQDYLRDRTEYKQAAQIHEWAWGSELPMLTERYESSGALGAYFHQDQQVARWIYEASPQRHVDVGSRLDGFIGSLSVFRPVEVKLSLCGSPRPLRLVCSSRSLFPTTRRPCLPRMGP